MPLEVIRKGMTSTALSRAGKAVIFATLVSAALPFASQLGRAQDAAAKPIAFDIAAQPLSQALIAYSEATGLEVFYKAVLAEGQHSQKVHGSLPPAMALKELLRGTGYVARTTGAGAFTIETAPQDAADVPDPRRSRYEPYFAVVQSRVSDALCRNPDAGKTSDEVLLRVWLSPSGTFARVEVISDDGSRAADQTVAATMQGLAMGLSPPSSMPQPVNMVIFPASKNPPECQTRAPRMKGVQ